MTSNQQGDIQYRFTEINDLAGRIHIAQGQVHDLQTDIKTSATNLQGVWSASAGEAWSTVQVKWDNACTGLNTALNNLSVAVRQAHDEMYAMEAKNTAMWQR